MFDVTGKRVEVDRNSDYESLEMNLIDRSLSVGFGPWSINYDAASRFDPKPSWPWHSDLLDVIISFVNT